jgi:hypothetical protein
MSASMICSSDSAPFLVCWTGPANVDWDTVSAKSSDEVFIVTAVLVDWQVGEKRVNGRHQLSMIYKSKAMKECTEANRMM